MMADTPAMEDHILLTYKKASRRLESLNDLSGGMDIINRGPLISALNRLSCIPFFSFPVIGWQTLEFSVGGEEAGTLGNPKIDVILKHSKLSPFGRGEETVVDESYRRGHEVIGADIKISSEFSNYGYKGFLSSLGKCVSAALFVPRQAKLKLYKLAIYREGGHFDWHVDTTHSDSHHATVLVALNTDWTGGDFILRRDGVETRMDMKPKIDPPSPEDPESSTPFVDLRAVAFYTDTEHKVEPITEGVRIVLQFDVEVEGWVTKKTDPTKTSAPDQHIDKKHKTTHEGDDDDEDDEDEGYSPLHSLQTFYKERKTVLSKSVPTGDPDAVNDIVNEINRLLTTKAEDGQKEVAFALQYLYRKSSILPEYLKGSDSLLYQALSKTFDVQLLPVVLYEKSDYEGNYRGSESDFAAFVFPHKFHGESNDGDTSDSDGDRPRYRYGRRYEPRRMTFHLPRSSAIKQISQRDYVEHAGNECIFGEAKYFGAGMFLKSKNAEDC